LDDIGEFLGLVAHLFRVHRKEFLAPDGLPLVYLTEFVDYCKVSWLTGLLPRALSVATHKFSHHVASVADPGAPEFVSKVFMTIVDFTTDEVMNHTSARHSAFLLSAVPDVDMYQRRFGTMPRGLLVQDHVWMQRWVIPDTEVSVNALPVLVWSVVASHTIYSYYNTDAHGM
jgi:hypothetical protein